MENQEKKTELGMATRSIHVGELEDIHGSPHTPVYTSTTFRFKDTASLLEVVDGKKPGSLYTRYGMNPSIFSLEQKLASLEQAEAAWVFCSGMAAEAALFLTHGRQGIVCLGDAYGGTLELLQQQLPLLGIPTYFLLGHELEQLEDLLSAGKVGLIFFETPTNPTLEIFDIVQIAALAKRHGVLVAVDNTFASPVNQQPLQWGADLVVHSATKYLGGHSDLTAGVVMGSQALLQPIWGWRKNLGQMPSPETAAKLSRSVKTLSVRVQQQNQTAQYLAEKLAQHPRVLKVLYPGLPDFPGHTLAAQQMSGFGGMLSLILEGNAESTSQVADRLQLFALAPSLGGVESLVTQPVTTTHHGLGPEERQQRGISDALLRLSVGLENAEDLLADLQQALD
ncbi:MAG: PLP-dependent aspartate aminotransferase family protein [Candidatus Sericytochromatia bacterium]